jgi:tetratricopeptide (TPR) repeat protein
MKFILSKVGAELGLSINDQQPKIAVSCKSACQVFERWIEDYNRALRQNCHKGMFSLGCEIYSWLRKVGMEDDLPAQSSPTLTLEVRVDASELDHPTAHAVFDVPWELAATPDGYLAEDLRSLFIVNRRVGAQGEAWRPRHGNVSLLFMAGASKGNTFLAIEAEEAAIVQAKKDRPLSVAVEESGCVAELAKRIQEDSAFEALHLTCHGTIDSARGPLLQLEDEVGKPMLVAPEEIVALATGDLPPLMFLSACFPAELGSSEERRRVHPFARTLARAGVHNAIGWGAVVSVGSARDFTEFLYRALAEGKSVPEAVAIARRELCRANRKDGAADCDWHLARLYLGPAGGGALVAAELPRVPSSDGEYSFVKDALGVNQVAFRSAFVGRRREIQAVLKTFRQETAPGVLIHGMAGLGKSSLAARIAARMGGHRTIFVFDQCDAVALFDRVVEAVPGGEAGITGCPHSRVAIQKEPALLGAALEFLLSGPLAAAPILLWLDDLNYAALDTSIQSNRTPLVPVRESHAGLLAAVLSAFARQRGRSRLLITSRYLFTLSETENGSDLAAGLMRVPLCPMSAAEQQLMFLASVQPKIRNTLESGLVADILSVAAGNPALQAALTAPVVAGDPSMAAAFVGYAKQVRTFWQPPDALTELCDDEYDAQAAVRPMAALFSGIQFDEIDRCMSNECVRMFLVVRLFSPGVSIPRAVVEVAASAVKGIKNPAAALDRLLAMGFANDFGSVAGFAVVGIDPLVRNAIGGTVKIPADDCIAVALPVLDKIWRATDADADGEAHWLWAAELVMHALALPVELQAPDLPDILDRAATAVAFDLIDKSDLRNAYSNVLKPALKVLERLNAKPSVRFASCLCKCAKGLRLDDLWRDAVELINKSAETASDMALAHLCKGQYLYRLRQWGGAEQAAKSAADFYFDDDDTDSWILARCDLARAMKAQGRFDEALEIYRDELLPFSRGATSSQQVAVLCEIAEVLEKQGEQDAALRIYETEVLPLVESGSDRGEVAIAHGRIARIKIRQGRGREVKELVIHGLLPAYARMGNARWQLIVRGWIADIQWQEGDRGEALEGYEALLDDLTENGEPSEPDLYCEFSNSIAQVRIELLRQGIGDQESIVKKLLCGFQCAQRYALDKWIASLGGLLGRRLPVDAATRRAVLTAAVEASLKIGAQEDAERLKKLL